MDGQDGDRRAVRLERRHGGLGRPVGVVAVLVEAHAEELQALDDATAQRRRVLAGAAGEGQHVDAAQCGRVGTDRLAHPVGVGPQRGLRVGVAFGGAALDVAQVAAGT
ncbi:MAG: hypothetical protein ABT20_03140 [Rubrivivax sp. SCN 70-15]|nr:MAG: hypothetical protein ABT20_03140 [Rubrivivax sp. SCN 70-15]